MTKEEIKQLPSIVGSFLDAAILNEVRQHLNEKLDEVCKLAIKALEAQSSSNEFFNFDAPMVKNSEAESEDNNANSD